MTFHKVVIGFLACSALALVMGALRFPPGGVAQSPHAVLLVPDQGGFETASGAVAMVRQAKREGFSPLTVSSLTHTFSQLDYDLDQLRDGDGVVPRLFVASMPSDMRAIRMAEKRKVVFFKTVLPLVLRVNAEIAAERRRLVRIRADVKAGKSLPADDRLWIAAMAERYDVARSDLKALAKRMDVVPPSLALAQAAEESGWGTSRFVREGNALFGQWTFARGRHLIPEERDDDKSHRVRVFTHLIDAVRAYVMNLNTHRAYRRFRDKRQAIRNEGDSLTGLALASTLTNYSERGAKYVLTIRDIIQSNRLQALDTAQLGDEMVETASKPAI